jgi:hypothetical protein
MKQFRVVNLTQPDNKKWKRFADILLYLLPEVVIAMLLCPFSAETIMWINSISAVVTVVIKAITKFTAEVPVEIVPIVEPAK